MLVLRRVLDQFCEQNRVPLDDPLAIAAAQELVRMWQNGNPTEAELASDLRNLKAPRGAMAMQSEAQMQF